MMNPDYDVAVVGGGLVGAAVAWGLGQTGARVASLDEGDIAVRPSRGNFALVWVQGKGLGKPEYAAWTHHSSEIWAGFAATLRDQTGVDVRHERRGGFAPALTEQDLENRVAQLRRLHNQPLAVPYDHEVLDHAALKKELPHIGPDVAGATYCPRDGHVNSLKLLRALHAGMAATGVAYLPNRRVETVEPLPGGGFALRGAWGETRAGKVVLAAGHDVVRLAPMVGLTAPVRPQRGHVIVTEKAEPFLDRPTIWVRQTDEGGVMIGDSFEEVGLDATLRPGVSATIAQRAIRIFPILGSLNVVRSWAALRVLTPDGFPIYQQSAQHPGAFVVTCHSGVTLAAAHAQALAPHIAAGALPADFDAFSADRFHVSETA
jgi:hydrogen cyanide synthase HcnC